MLNTQILIKTINLVPQLFNNDIAVFNKLYNTYIAINNACRIKLFDTVPMGYVYIIVILGAFSQLLGTKIGKIINHYTGKENS